MKPPWGHLIRIAVLAVIAYLVVRYLRHLDGRAIWHATAQSNPIWLVVAILGNVPLVWFKAVRLRAMLGRRIGIRDLMGIFFTSYAADNLVMSQAGLGVRVALLRPYGVSVSNGAAIQVAEKIFEGLGLAALALPLLQHDLGTWIAKPLFWFLVVALVTSLAIVAVMVFSRKRAQMSERFAEVMKLVAEPRFTIWMFVLTMGGWVMELFMVMACLQAMHIEAPLIIGSILVMVAVSLAALIPGLPANVGPFEVSCVLALKTFHVPPDKAIGFALLYHVIHTVPVTLVGLPGFRRMSRARLARASINATASLEDQQ